MQKVVLFVALALCCVAVSALPTDEEYRLLFTNWAHKFNKTYAAAEVPQRLSAWKANYDFVTKHNQLHQQGLKTFTVGMNQLADLTNLEYRQKFLGYRRVVSNPRRGAVYAPQPVQDLPDSVDWRSQGVITDVKDQGQCGSCWSFSATGSMEGAHALSTGNLISLSEQNLIDCVQNGQYTCDTGGVMQDGFQWVIDNGGIESEDEYPYCTCSGNQCQFDQSQVVATISAFQNVNSGDEGALQSAAASQPGVSVAIDASQQSFQLYSGGVYYEPACSSTQLDHGVLVVGYGNDGGSDYWLVKNSWSASWGLQGYIEMARNQNNNCGIATDASFPTV